jgi:hypothetical protein
LAVRDNLDMRTSDTSSAISTMPMIAVMPTSV